MLSYARQRIAVAPMLRIAAVVALGGLVSACAETAFVAQTAKRINSTPGEEPSAKAQNGYKIGNPYQVNGVWYYPAEDFNYDETGIASWYGPGFHSKTTANGEIYDQNELTAAHKTLQLPALVRVTNLENGRSIVLKINDRGPYVHGRIIDVSRRGAQLLGFEGKGTAPVRVTVLTDESRALAAKLKGETMLARNETPITVVDLPKPVVSSSSLPPPAGARASAPTVVAALPRPAPAPAPVVTKPEAVVGAMSFTAPQRTDIFIQAGAFSQYDNANRVNAKLSSVGKVQVSSVLVNGRDLFRVRVGPLASVEVADRVLEQVIGAGYPDARIIVD